MRFFKAVYRTYSDQIPKWVRIGRESGRERVSNLCKWIWIVAEAELLPENDIGTDSLTNFTSSF